MTNPAQILNETLEHTSPQILRMLSTKGKSAFFPHGGILGQTAQARGKRYNATIGIALEEDGSPMRLPAMTEEIDLPPKDVFPYASSFGKQPLREQWQKMIYEKNPSLRAPISMPVVTAALTHGLTVAGYLFLDPGDSLLLSDAYWGNYKLTFAQQFGVTLEPFSTFCEGGFNVDALRQALAKGGTGKKVVLLNFPNNPSGYTPTEAEAAQIVDVLKESADNGNQIVALLDDAYFGLVYEDGIYKESLFCQLADAHEQILAVKIDGATKEDYAWGMRVGFLTYGFKGMTPEVANVLEDKTAGVVRGTVSNVPHLSQTLVLQTYECVDYQRQKQEKYDLLKARYQEVLSCLQTPQYAEYFTALPFNSGYFMCVELADGLEAEEVRTLLLEEFDTGVIATGNLLRIAYSSLPTADIAPLFENLYLACKSLLPTPKSLTPIHHEPVHA